MIEELSDGKKEAFSMFLSGFSYQEISDSMGVSIGTTKSRIFNARKELQSRLKVML
jgi:RNA polymerase sigma-70 factor (ECF subfamily)